MLPMALELTLVTHLDGGVEEWLSARYGGLSMVLVALSCPRWMVAVSQGTDTDEVLPPCLTLLQRWPWLGRLALVVVVWQCGQSTCAPCVSGLCNVVFCFCTRGK